MTFAGLLCMIATVKRRSVADDGMGGDAATWETAIASYKCRIYSGGAGLRRDVPGEYSASTHSLIGEDTEIHAGDELEVGDARYTVLGPDWPANRVYSAGGPHHVEVYLKGHG